MQYVNIYLNGQVLATVPCVDISSKEEQKRMIVNHYKERKFPDSDRLYLEDIQGHRFKRINLLGPHITFRQI